MASPESKQIRATFVKNPEAINTPLEIQRQEWETAVEAVNQTLKATVEPVDLDGIPGEWVRYEDTTGEGVILHLHGGGFNAGSCKTHRAMAAHLAMASGAPVLTLDYRLAPEYPCPAAIEDSVKAYRWLLQNGFSSRQIVLGGDSAGGGLALTALVKIRDDLGSAITGCRVPDLSLG
jgi:epsilon-lactone hydrolase